MKLKPLSGLTRPLLVFLQIMLVLDVIAIPIGGYNLYEYSHLAPGVDAAQTVLKSDLAVGIMGICQGLFGLITGIIFLRWLYRANYNLRRMTTGIVFRCTPGWAAGWFFVPFANLWKPYEATQEIWTVAQRGRPVASPVGRWWGLWILSSILDRVAAKLAQAANDANLYQLSAATFMLADMVSVALNLAALQLVRSVAQGYSENFSETNLPEEMGLEVGLTPSP